MKHNLKVTAIILLMFLITQFIGIYVVSYYSSVKFVDGETINVESPNLPYGLESPELESNSEFSQALIMVVFAFIIAISLMLLLSKLKIELFMKLWFFFVIAIALGISLNVFLFNGLNYSFSPFVSILIITAIAGILAFVKIFKRNFFVHNLTELFVYPGIAAIFVPILNIYTLSALLILISAYDMWAVWHSGIMQKMAKYQIQKLNIFAGFFVPSVPKNVKLKMKKLKPEELKKKKFRVNVAVLGGGDVIFPIIASGVMLKTLGLVPALIITVGATIGLGSLLLFSEKKKFYPAMPFISAGIFAGILLSYLFF